MSATTTAVYEVAPEVKSFVEKTHRLLIDGQWVEAKRGQVFKVYNPANGEVIAHVAEGNAEDIDLAVKAARRAFEEGPWRKMTPSERGRLIWKLADLVEQHLEEFAQLETLDNGKPLTVSRAADVPLAWICSATWPVGPPRSKAKRFHSLCREVTIWPTHCVSQ